MAATSYHHYQNKGIWILDARLELFLHFMIIVWDKSYTQHKWLDDELRRAYQMNSEGLFPDMMDLYLNKLLIDAERVKTYQQLLADTQALIISHAPSLSVAFIENLRIKKPLLPQRDRPLLIEELTEVGDALSDLIGEGN